MKGFKGSKGEWKCSPIFNFSDTLISYIGTDNKAVAQLRGCNTGEELEAEANAKLIAAAPDLLEALKYTLGTLRIFGLNEDDKAIVIAKEAIKKALD